MTLDSGLESSYFRQLRPRGSVFVSLYADLMTKIRFTFKYSKIVTLFLYKECPHLNINGYIELHKLFNNLNTY